MKKIWILIAGIALLLVAAGLMATSPGNQPQSMTATPNSSKPPAQTPAPGHEHSTSAPAKIIPAYLKAPPSKASLAPTLNPESFTGITRDAYRAVREIPVTIAQLPCYCHCDQGFGHKSLYSCYEDDHASHCDVCVREALLAFKLEKEQKMTPAQIRETIVKQYSH
ncbi:MAG TPA: CYCXC family (seleno)protein [Pyrinomonadaceae bacterium]|nr:CYCXC family (seleno)protein [Pyrinomonadaceae bacterium]